MTGQSIDLFPVTVPARTGDVAPVEFDPARARLSRAADVVAGDLVLGWVMTLPNGRQVVDYHADPYEAAPIAHDPNCGCGGHASLTADDSAKELTVLTDGFPWDACDVMPSTDLVLIVPAARPAPLQTTTKKKEALAMQTTTKLPKLRQSGDGWTFTHRGAACTVYRNASDPALWDVRGDSGPLATRRTSRSQAIRDAIAVLDGDTSGETGFDTLARLLDL